MALAAPMVAASKTSVFAAAADKKYVFYHLLWGMTDPNVQFHIKAGEAFMKSSPDVEIKYVGPEAYDPAEHAKFLDTIINANPNGIALHISSPDALVPGLKKAKEKGIPVVSVTSHPPGASDEAKIKGLYLVWSGADETLIGGRMAARLLQAVPQPKHVIYAMAHLGHAGQEMRAKGFFESMPAGVKTDKVATGEEPEHAKDVLRSFLTANTDVDAIFGTALANKQMSDVVEDLGRTNIQLLTADDAPSSLEGVLQGKFLATFSQQFPIQAPFAYEALLLYNQTTMAPVAPIVTGPLVVDKSNAQVFKDQALVIFGKDGYYKLSPY
jgi:simple sugar transport system substrate-binding protein